MDAPLGAFRLITYLQPLFCFAVYVPKPAAFAAGEPRAPFLVHAIPWRASEVLFKDFYHVLFNIFRWFAELHSFCQFLKNRHFSFLSPNWRVAAAVSFDDSSIQYMLAIYNRQSS